MIYNFPFTWMPLRESSNTFLSKNSNYFVDIILFSTFESHGSILSGLTLLSFVASATHSFPRPRDPRQKHLVILAKMLENV